MQNTRYRDDSLERNSQDCESLLKEGTNNNSHVSKTQDRLQHITRPIVLAAIVCLALLAGFFLGSISQALPLLNRDSTCAAHIEQGHPPLLDDVAITYKSIPFNGSFMHANVYRQDAGPEVDAAWKELGVDYRALRIPEDKAEAAGITRDHVRIAKEHGGGYPANVEGLHHLHCLNLLRKALPWNVDYYTALGEGAFKNDEKILKVHVTHCLDILRQQLMCTVDVGVFGQVWVDPSKPHAFVDFNTDHKCKNYDAVRRWAEERQLPENPPDGFLEPPSSESRILPETP